MLSRVGARHQRQHRIKTRKHCTHLKIDGALHSGAQNAARHLGARGVVDDHRVPCDVPIAQAGDDNHAGASRSTRAATQVLNPRPRVHANILVEVVPPCDFRARHACVNVDLARARVRI